MPSRFNNENSCWGVMKPRNDLLHYAKQEEKELRKQQDTVTTPSACPLQFSVSSNGYYGYHPHSVVADRNRFRVTSNVDNNSFQDCNQESAMDVEENGSNEVITFMPDQYQFRTNCNALLSSNQCQKINRKRQMQHSSPEDSKRKRKTGSVHFFRLI